jgi:L-amino acid N-acyltransferase YncA
MTPTLDPSSGGKETTMPKAKSKRDYPRNITLDNNTSVSLRLMTAADADRIMAFARGLPEEDLLFLRSDITDPKIVAQWVQNLAADRTVTVVAEAAGELAGYASLHYNQVTWQRHLGEIRIQVGPRYRSHGLGRALAGEIFNISRELGLRKIVAQMTADQKGAIATFERLGFQPEALLQDFVMDRSGRTHDRVVMSHDVEGLTDRVD